MPKLQWPTSSDLDAFIGSLGIPYSESDLDFKISSLENKVQAARAGWERDTQWKPFLNGSYATSNHTSGGSNVAITVNDSSDFQAGGSVVIDAGAVQETQPVVSVPGPTSIVVATLTSAHDGRTTPFRMQSIKARSYDPPGPQVGPTGLYVGIKTVGGSRRLFLHAGLIAITSVYAGVDMMTPNGTLLTPNDDYWLRPQSAPGEGVPYTSLDFRILQYGEPMSLKITGAWGYGNTIPDDAWEAVLLMAAKECLPEMLMGISQGTSSFKSETAEANFLASGKNPLQLVADQWVSKAQQVKARYIRVSL